MIPLVFFSYFDNEYGPRILFMVPHDTLEMEYLLTVTKLYTNLEAKLITQLGHVYSTDPVSKPTIGNLMSIAFSHPHQDARGGYIIMSISVMIPHEFENISVTITKELKHSLFKAVESVRTMLEDHSWELEDDFAISEVVHGVDHIIHNLRTHLAKDFAAVMDRDLVRNWR